MRTETARGWLWRVWWEVRFITQAFLQRDFEDARVQRLVDERLRREGKMSDFQRPLDEARVRLLFENFDPELAGPIVVKKKQE